MPSSFRTDSSPILLVVATRNDHKLREIQSILGPVCHCQSLQTFPDAPTVVEDAPTFEGNAIKKSVQLARWLAVQKRVAPPLSPENFYVLADDYGLEVDALNGAPGVNSARFAARDRVGNSPDTDNNAKLLRLLANVPLEHRKARFRCVLALTRLPCLRHDDISRSCLEEEQVLPTELFRGACEGRIDFAPKGSNGFGYDPLFLPDGMESSFAELSQEQKNRISHRARALEKLVQYFSQSR